MAGCAFDALVQGSRMSNNNIEINEADPLWAQSPTPAVPRRKFRDRLFSRAFRKFFRNRARYALRYPLLLLKSAMVRSSNINDHEFSVLSQHGEDGIIHYVFKTLRMAPKTFVEFGFHPQECNALVPLIRHRAKGLFMDGNHEVCDLAVKTFSLLARKIAVGCHMLRPDNINAVIAGHGIHGDIDLLSIDVDSIDYWLWDSIDGVSAKLVIIETSPWLGTKRAVTMPMDDAAVERLSPEPIRNVARGASPAALLALGRRKGYEFLGADSSGINMFFLRADLYASGLFKDSASGSAAIFARRALLGDAEVAALVSEGLLLAVA
jgi:hypothetical protein